ncbi:MAG: FAD-dependent oxidoreductase, partial [Lachnospiraceae bacterium]|nr:FAD-dependent oxidoreductase [Lachnospiraceae bacterium]
MQTINQLRLTVGHTEEQLRAKIAKKLGLAAGTEFTYEIVRRSLDARKKPQIYYVYTVDVGDGSCRGDRPRSPSVIAAADDCGQARAPGHCPSPLIVGAGPAGLFCAYTLAQVGLRPILLERGEAIEERTKTVARFGQEGILDPESNVQFGEGGAGAFSDGKLNTQIKDREGWKKAVLSVLVDCGAPAEIIYEQKPHLGTDVLAKVVAALRERIIEMGGEVRFQQKVTGIVLDGDKITGVIINDGEEIAASQVVLAIGHSARDTFTMLHEANVPLEVKPFAVGLRVEHPQAVINQAQYGVAAHPILGAAEYKLASKSEPSAYSFCMCPGGFVVNASSEPNRLAINGMSYSARRGSKANAAIVMPVGVADFGSDHPLAGLEYQRRLEERAFAVGGGAIPVAYFGDFREAVYHKSDKVAPRAMRYGLNIIPCTKGKWYHAPVHEILTEAQNHVFIRAMEEFGRLIPSFDDELTLIAGVESRTSSPVRILRDEHCQ